MRPASVRPVRDALIPKQDVKHFSADLVLVIAPHSWVVNALKIICPYLSNLSHPTALSNTSIPLHCNIHTTPAPPPSTLCF